MALSINVNLPSLNAQRNLNKSGGALAQSLQRLSSGLRLNSARDDAAGIAIATRFTSQIRGLNQAARNANDGISLAQTAEGALEETVNNLQRLRELSVQSANATNSASDRASLQAEVTELVAEITRVGDQTAFNGITLLDGTFATQKFQVGADANQTISISQISDARSTALGSHDMTLDGTILGSTSAAAADVSAGNNVVIEADLTLTTVDGGTTTAISYAADAGADAIASAINTAAGGIGITATATNTATLSGVVSTGAITMTLNGSAVAATIANTGDLSTVLSAINGVTGATGITASFTSSTAKDSLTLTTSDGRDIDLLDFTHAGTTKTVAFSGVTVTGGGVVDSSIKAGTVKLSSTQGQITTANAGADVFASAGTNTSTLSSVSSMDISTDTGAQSAIAVLDAALSTVNSIRGSLGAIQNRFSSTVASIQTSTENLSASRSRIQDADFAKETAALTRGQILQQAGIAMLSQANSLPQSILSLLQ